MRVHELKDDAGRLIAFEVPNFGRHRCQRFVASVPGVTVLRRQRRLQIGSQEEFCEFELGGERFVVSEPWNDSSRYWIGQSPPRPSPALETLRTAFAAQRRFGRLQTPELAPPSRP